MRNYFFYVLASVLSIWVESSFAQNEELDQFYLSTYEPKELNRSSIERIDGILDLYSKDKSLDSVGEIEYEEFVYRSNYFVERLNRSGQVFFGDSISAYLNELKDLLLDSVNRDKVKIYLTANPSFNAFANDFGSIYVNISVLAKLESEEQLLAILAHEISHFIKQHNHSYDKMLTKISKETESEAVAELLLRHKFSKEQEFSADLLGFKMLDSLGVDLKKALKVFDYLEFDLNPVVSSEFDLNVLSEKVDILNRYLKDRLIGIENNYLLIKPDSTDSLLTHPAVQKRRGKIVNFINSKQPNTITYVPKIQRFNSCKENAQQLLIDSYIQQGWYIEALDLVVKMRAKNYNSEWLIKKQAKLLVLLTQFKYHQSPFDQFLNNNGTGFSDSSFLKKKEMLLGLNSLETNMISMLVVKEMMAKYDIPYLKRCYCFLVKFLYKYNEEMFIPPYPLTMRKVDSNYYKIVTINNQELIYNLKKDEHELFEEITKERGGVSVVINNLPSSDELVKYFLSKFELQQEEMDYIEEYKQTRDNFDEAMKIHNLDIEFSPLAAIIKYKGGEYYKTKLFDVTKRVGLVSSFSFFQSYDFDKGFKFEYKNSLIFEDKMMKQWNISPEIVKNYNVHCQNVERISVRKTLEHKLLKVWVMERIGYEDLIYSSVDEEVIEIAKRDQIQYLLVNFNGMSKSSIGNYKKVFHFYNFYFDIENGAIVYMTKYAKNKVSVNRNIRKAFKFNSSHY